MTGELGRQVGGRRPDTKVPERANIVRARAESLQQVAAVAHQYRARPIREEQGLVRIEGDAVGKIDPGEEFPALREWLERPPRCFPDGASRVMT